MKKTKKPLSNSIISHLCIRKFWFFWRTVLCLCSDRIFFTSGAGWWGEIII